VGQEVVDGKFSLDLQLFLQALGALHDLGVSAVLKFSVSRPVFIASVNNKFACSGSVGDALER